MEPKDIENPQAEDDFRHQLRAEKEVNKISSNLSVSGSVFHCDICSEKATQAYRYQGSIEYLYRCEKHLR